MLNKKSKKVYPIRSCIGCGRKDHPKKFIRLTIDKNCDIVIDKEFKMGGRGAYLCPDISCLKKALKRNKISKSLKVDLKDEMIEKISKKIEAGIYNFKIKKKINKSKSYG